MAVLEPLSVFNYHGVDFNGTSGDKEMVSNCPFCGAENHFYVNKETGQFDCKQCFKSGNAYTFMHYLHEKCLSGTKQSQYSKLAKNRCLPPSAFSEAELAYDSDMNRWLIPIRNDRGTMVNLRTWGYPMNGEKPAIYNTRSCSASLYGLHHLSPTGPIYICEGEWDAISLEWLLDKNKITKGSVIAVPGANTFKDCWCDFMAGRQVILLFDNDEAGLKGCKKLANKLASLSYSKRPSSIHVLCWPESTPDKYDLRDLITSRPKKPELVWQTLQTYIIPYDQATHLHNGKVKSLLPRRTFRSIVQICRKYLYAPKEFEESLALSCATIFSSSIDGEPLWMFVVGPPSCGKTLILRLFRNCPNAIYKSRLTAKVLVSGYKTDDGADPSLMAKMIGQCFILKDFTEITTMPSSEQDVIYGILRGFYDGFVEVSYGNNITREYEGYCSILAGVTPAIYKESRVTVGERFLKFNMIRPGYDHDKHVRRSLDAKFNSEQEIILRETIADFMDQELTEKNLPKLPESYKDKIIALSQIIAHLRATVERRNEEPLYRPCAEVATRLAKQLIKLSQCLAFTYGLNQVDEDCYNLVEKVAFDTATGWAQDVLLAIAATRTGITKADICSNTQISASSVERSLQDLADLNVIRYRTSKRKLLDGGRPTRIWYLTKYMSVLWRQAKPLVKA